MPVYEAISFVPPAPVAHVTLKNRNTGVAWADVPMLLDTGADVTLVPLAVIDHLGLEASSTVQYELEGFGGSTSLAQVVHLELIFLRRTFRGQFLLVDQEWGIIGRNILNSVSILLNGPASTWDEFKQT